MQRRIILGAIACTLCSAALAEITFDTASIKPATAPAGVTVSGDKTMVRKGAGIPIPRNTGGPGNDDPGRIHYPLISLKALLSRAWDSYFEIRGPAWLDDDLVSVDATMPAETTKEQFQEMLRNLIIQRFALKYHAESKEITGYALVAAKNGSKLTRSVDQDATPAGPPLQRPTARDADGFMILPGRAGSWCAAMENADAHARIVCQQKITQELTQQLGRLLNSTVTDATLTARYDFMVTYQGALGPGAIPSDTSEPLPDIFTALQAQLGLKLEPRKVPVAVLVIDQMEKTPTRN